MQEDCEHLARVTAAECGFEAVRWWQDHDKPQLLRIEAQRRIGKDRITVIFTTLMPEAGLPFMTALVSASGEPGGEERQLF